MKKLLLGNLPQIDIRQIVRDAVKKHAEEIELLNKVQLKQGIKSNGLSLGKYANFKYKKRFEPVDLFKTGKFYSKIKLTATLTGFNLDAYKYNVKGFDLGEHLKRNYTGYIFGLTDQYKEFTGRLILPTMKKDYRNKLGI